MKKVVIITGGSTGLGLAMVKQAMEEYTVVAASRSCSADLQALIDAPDSSVHYEKLDLADIPSLHTFAAMIRDKYGAPYGLINNAAIAHEGILGTMHETQIEELIMVNVTATIILTKYISRLMMSRREGRIINVSSIIASTGFNGLSVYAASKSALLGFTRSLARELGKVKITVNALAPGYMETNMSAGIDDSQLQQISRRSALRRLTTTDEAASAATYLLSPLACAVTGTTVTIDAGNTA